MVNVKQFQGRKPRISDHAFPHKKKECVRQYHSRNSPELSIKLHYCCLKKIILASSSSESPSMVYIATLSFLWIHFSQYVIIKIFKHRKRWKNFIVKPTILYYNINFIVTLQYVLFYSIPITLILLETVPCSLVVITIWDRMVSAGKKALLFHL